MPDDYNPGLWAGETPDTIECPQCGGISDITKTDVPNSGIIHAVCKDCGFDFLWNWRSGTVAGWVEKEEEEESK